MLEECTVYLLRMGKTFKSLLSSYWQEVIDNPLSEYLYLAFSFRLSADIECDIVFCCCFLRKLVLLYSWEII